LRTQRPPLSSLTVLVAEKEFGPEHRYVGMILSNLGRLFGRTGAYGQGETLLKRAIAIHEKLGVEHPDTAESLNSLADLYCESGAYLQAQPVYQRSLAILQKRRGPEHPYTARALRNLGVVH
jgi:tetratricopeptide (TPR) repeat protein